MVGSLTSLAFLGSLSFATSIEALQTLAHSGHLDTMHQSFWVGVLAGCHFVAWIVVFVLIGGEVKGESTTYFGGRVYGTTNIVIPDTITVLI